MKCVAGTFLVLWLLVVPVCCGDEVGKCGKIETEIIRVRFEQNENSGFVKVLGEPEEVLKFYKEHVARNYPEWFGSYFYRYVFEYQRERILLNGEIEIYLGSDESIKKLRKMIETYGDWGR